MAKNNKNSVISIRVDKDSLLIIDDFSKLCDITRSEFVRISVDKYIHKLKPVR